jgi:DNA helicase HerA-like ATPase
MKLHIATDLALPIEAVTQTFGILGKRGGGKSYTAKVMAEEMVRAKAHIACVDPIGNWWGLRVGADGKSPGLPITVIGGEYGDILAAKFWGRRLFDNPRAGRMKRAHQT